MAKKSKKKKSVKKYAVGGDMRVGPAAQRPLGGGSGPQELTMMPPDWRLDGGFGGGGYDETATGQVRQISDSARMAADRLRGAGEAQQQAGSMLGNVGGPRAPLTTDELGGLTYKKGGKVKKSAKTSVKVRGVGRAVQKKIRPAKMVSMKGS